MKKIKIFLADDHLILREGLKHIIAKADKLDIIGEAGDGREALEAIGQLKPDIAILDISMPSMSGIEVTRQLKKFYPAIKIIILTQYDMEEYVEQLLEYNIDGYILKDNAGIDLIKAINKVINGNVFLSPKIAKRIISSFSQHKATFEDKKSPFSILTSREMEILRLITEGLSSNAIGKKLFISDKTVKNHRANIMKKLNLHSTAELVKYAMLNKII